MTVDDRTRLNLHRKLEDVLGPEEANTLMEHLPPVTWHEVATKDGLAAHTVLMRSEMHEMGATLRGEMHEMGTRLHGEIQQVDTNVQVGFANLRSEFIEGTNRQIKWLVTFAAAWSSLLIAAVRLIP